jgi:hypothetical protein
MTYFDAPPRRGAPDKPARVSHATEFPLSPVSLMTRAVVMNVGGLQVNRGRTVDGAAIAHRLGRLSRDAGQSWSRVTF